MSRLKKKLSGEKILEKDPVDDIMDRYLRPDYDRKKVIDGSDYRNQQETLSRGGNTEFHKSGRKRRTYQQG